MRLFYWVGVVGVLSATLATCAYGEESQTSEKWKINSDGSIIWNVEGTTLPHRDHIEMSGEQVSTVLRYGVDENGAFELERSMVWPMLRTIPNNTHASLMLRFKDDVVSQIRVDDAALTNEKVQTLRLNGTLEVVSEFTTSRGPIRLTRTIFPSTTLPLLCEQYQITNLTDANVALDVPDYRSEHQTDASRGVNGSYTTLVELRHAGKLSLSPNDSYDFAVFVQAWSVEKQEKKAEPNIETELANRRQFVQEMWKYLVLESPEPVVNTLFAFSKIRTSESIYRTSGGLMHGPGGESYYAAIWANDQAEYVGPFFPYLGYRTGNEASLNAYLHFARFMNPEYRPIPSSIVAEGKDIWNGAGDRGDAAMIAYGAARYAMVRGDVQEAKQLWPLIEWSLEYCRLQLNDQGVVRSDCDELEHRFPAGSANLCTSTLYYDALQSAVYLGRAIGVDASQLDTYSEQATTLHQNIEKYFGANMDGFETYRYYEGNDLLRSWICMPLVVGIHERAAGTIDALFSEHLWTVDGLLTQANSKTFWDRSTLYALRGVYAAGATQKATEYLLRYSRQRLLGEHVPYPIEAWPEGSQRHLAAESGLYCRIITEGIFGIRPTGLASFELTPRLPEAWPSMTLRNIRGFGHTFDIEVERTDSQRLQVTIRMPEKTVTKVIDDNTTMTVNL